MFLGHNIRLVRKKWGLNQDQFGARFDIKGQSISTYEKGTAEPKLAFLLQFSEKTGVSVNDLCTKPLDESQLPDTPLYNPPTATPMVTNKPGTNYDLLKPEDIAEPLYNIHILVAEIKRLRERVEDLERKIG